MYGHLWTILPRLRRVAPFPGEPWRGTVVDPRRGRIELSGWLRVPAEARQVVVLVHGLGGTADSSYLVATARACERLGAATLRLALRGADGRGTDFYHAGLTDDVAAALAARELAPFTRVLLAGFSLGGHVALRYASGPHDARLAAVAAVCSPLDLRAAQRAIDRPSSLPYRVYLLRRLKAAYAGIARRAAVPTPLTQVRRARTLREWDRLTVVPRFDFRDPDDYYARASVAPHLGDLRRPALLVAAPQDPLVPASSIAAAAAAAPALDLRWARGGHVAFPPRLDLGIAAPRGLASQLAGWLLGATVAPVES